MMKKDKSLPGVTKIDPFWESKRPGMLRARIAVKQEFLAQAHPSSQEWWSINQQIAGLERELKEQEDKSVGVS